MRTIHLLGLAVLLVGGLLAGCTCGTTTCGTCGEGTYCCKKTGRCEPVQPTCATPQSCPAGQELSYPSGPFMDEESCSALPLECTCAVALKPGVIGRFSSLASSNGALMASAYENDFGDLVLVTAKTSALGETSLELVDGVPKAVPTKATSGWRGGVEEPGDNVGQQTSIAVGKSGEPMISYLDVTNRRLKLAARSDGKWSSHVVDAPADGKAVVGRFTSLVLLDEKPAIAYQVINIEGPPGTFSSELRFAAAKIAAPASASDWTIGAIERRPMSCQGLCPTTDACVVMTDGSSVCQKKGTGCAAACASGEACIGSACKKVAADIKFAELPMASGLWPSAVSTKNGAIVVFYDRAEGKLKAAQPGGAGWKTATLDGGAGPADAGAFCHAVADSAGLVHVAYQTAKLTLKYAQVAAVSLAVGLTEVIDDGVRPGGIHPVGADNAILVDPSGAVRVLYQDQHSANLLLARRVGPNQWTPKAQADPDLGRLLQGGPKGYGFFSAMALDRAATFGSTFLVDASSPPPRGKLMFFAVP